MNDTTPFRPVLRHQADLERAWRHLLSPLGFAGHSLWIMLVEPDGRPVPHLTEVTDVVEPPSRDQLSGLVELIDGLRAGLPPGTRLAFLRSRPGRGEPRPDDLTWAAMLYTACRDAAMPCETVHLATDETVLPLPMDAVTAA